MGLLAQQILLFRKLEIHRRPPAIVLEVDFVLGKSSELPLSTLSRLTQQALSRGRRGANTTHDTQRNSATPTMQRLAPHATRVTLRI